LVELILIHVMHTAIANRDSRAYGIAQVLSAAYSPGQPDQLRQEGRVSGLYLMMGRGLERLQVPATAAALALCGYSIEMKPG
jgi:hypothetical protein